MKAITLISPAQFIPLGVSTQFFKTMVIIGNVQQSTRTDEIDIFVKGYMGSLDGIVKLPEPFHASIPRRNVAFLQILPSDILAETEK